MMLERRIANGATEPSTAPFRISFLGGGLWRKSPRHLFLGRRRDGRTYTPFSILSFALVYAGRFDGVRFERPSTPKPVTFYRELKPISESFQEEALRVNELNREHLVRTGQAPEQVMTETSAWVKKCQNQVALCW
jgi:hypothetical protein